MKAKLLQRTDTKPNVYTFDISGITTKTLMALSRHQSVSLTSQSSRYTMRKMTTGGITDTIRFTGIDPIDELMLKHMEEIAELTKDKSYKQDDLCMLLPQSYLYNVVMTVDEYNLEHFLGLRGEDSHAHFDMKLLAKCLTEAKDSEPLYDYKDGISNFVVSSTAIRKCYDTKPTGDDEKELALVKRIGISMKHMSVLRHILLTVDKKYATKYSIDIGDKIVINLQSLLETNTYDTLPPLGKLESLADAYYKSHKVETVMRKQDIVSEYISVRFQNCIIEELVQKFRNFISQFRTK